MRPIRLQLQGFTSFVSPQSLDFTSLDLFAITGPTGAGKTSILDAILYALYGATPRLGDRVGALVNLVSAALKVSLEFETGRERWRVTRTRRGDRTEALLERRQTDGEWEPVAGGVREVDGRIQSIVGLDFAGFTRSVILPQGKFDEFLRGDPSKRTAILKDLLGLHVYDRMRELANRRHGELRSQVDNIESTLSSILAGATEEKLAAQEAALEHALAHLGELQAAKSSVEDLRKLALDLRDQRKAAQVARAAASDAEKQFQALEETLKNTQSQLSSLEAQLAANAYDETQWTQLVQAAPLVRQKQQCEERLVRQRKEQREHAQAMAEKEAQCQQAMEKFISSKREAAARQSECDTAEQEWNSFRETHGSPDLIRDRLKALDDASRAAGANPDSRMEELRQFVAEAEQTLEHLRRQHAANEIRKHLKDGETCPVCEQVIRKLPEVSAVSAVDAARDLVTRAKSEEDAFRKRFDAWRAARERAAGCTEELLRHGLALEAAVIQARKAHADAAAAHNEAQHAVTRAQSALELTAARLAGLDREMKQTQDELRHLSVELAKYPDWAPLPLSELEASLEDQNAAKAKRNALIQEKQQLQNAAIESEARQLALKATIQARREEAERADSRSAELRPALQPHLESPMLGADEAEHFTAKLRGIEQQTAAANVAIGKARAEVSQLREQLHVAADMRKQSEELQREAEICHQLGNLLRADQFIAYIQREALERLAGEASKQLATLSSGNYTLTLSSDRNEFFVVDNWNGGAERPARTLSGGESFLASLSLALAFSQGLAGFGGEQSRSKLDSLFIDEGISSLDSDSLEIAISALEALTVGDRMVGVISHIAELGDRLNARIRVERTASGSRIHVDAGPAAATARA